MFLEHNGAHKSVEGLASSAVSLIVRKQSPYLDSVSLFSLTDGGV